MASLGDESLNAALPFRVYGLETQVATQDDAISRLRESNARNTEAIALQGATLARHDEQLKTHGGAIVEVKTDVAALAASIHLMAEKFASSTSRIAWTLTGVAFTVAGSAIGVIVWGG